VRKPTNRGITKCTIEVRSLPLEAFRLPTDGRKWKQAARTRKNVLLHLASYANPDGTFIGSHGRNFSPSHETLLEDFSKGGIHYATTALRELGLLSWTREDRHYGRRVYAIHLPEHSQHSPEQYPDSDGDLAKAGKNHSQDSTGTLSTFADKGQEHSQHSQITLSTSDPIPSLPTKERADKDFPTQTKTVASLFSPSAQVKGAGKMIREPVSYCEKCGDPLHPGTPCPSWVRA
jgi:hypothetical protein